MTWLLLVTGLALAGLPWFAALGLAILVFLFLVGLDPLVLALDFGRLRDFEQLLALPILLICARLLAPEAQRHSAPGPAQSASLKACVGDWLFDREIDAKKREVSGFSVPGLLIAPSAALVLVWAIMQALSSALTPDLQVVFLAGLVPALLAVAGTALWSRWCNRAAARPMASPGFFSRLAWILILLVLTGVYLGRWGVLETAAAAALALAMQRLLSGSLRPAHLHRLVLDSLRDFGQLALLVGLGLAWMAVVFDSGVDRYWLATMMTTIPAPIATASNPSLSGTYLGSVLVGSWVSVALIAGAWMVKPLPALVVGAPFIIPAALAAGMAPEQLALVSVLALYAGYRLGQREQGPGGSELTGLLLAIPITIALILLVPPLSLWLPGQLLAGG